MFKRTIGRRGIKPFIIGALSFAAPFAAAQVAPDADSRAEVELPKRRPRVPKSINCAR